MTGFWTFVAAVALFFLWLRYLARRRASATANGPADDWGEATGVVDARILDIRARAAKEPLENWLLQPEPVRQPSRIGNDTDDGSHGGTRNGGAPRRVAESVTAVLRKQIPPRGEPPRSWLGGLPMLPPDVQWPRGINPEDKAKGEVPLHFIAQVACADLPAELWGGLGPREGWLLLFVNGNTCEADNKGVWRVLHIAELGEDRQPPADIGPIHDGVYTGSTPLTLRESSYPRWPVDIVSMPNELRIEEGRSLAAPADLAKLLYPGAEVAADRWARPSIGPFTWRCLALAIDGALDGLTGLNAKADGYRSKMRAKLAEPGMIDDIVPELERQEAKFWSDYGAMLNAPDTDDIPPPERERRAAMRIRASERRKFTAEIAALIAEYPTPAALLDFLDRQDENRWKEDAAAYLRQLRDFADQQGLDSPFSEQAWAEVRRELGQIDHDIWALAWGRGDAGLPVTLERRTLSAMTYLAPRLASASEEQAIACYTDRERHALVPASAASQFEAKWRALPENRPHRMGGYHDGLQSDAQPGATDRLLLMQFAVDDALHWVWGDCGAVYCFIAPQHLEDRAWDQAEFHLECH